jgi:hypothetical protein
MTIKAENGDAMKKNDKQELIIYNSSDGKATVEATFHEDNLWLSLNQIAELYGKDKSTISRHIKNILAEGELSEKSVVANFATTAADGKIYQVDYYNVDMILAVGYRVNSPRGTQFRIWATNTLHEYLQKGFALNDDKLKNLGGGKYWYELLERIKDIRASEKVLYRQVLGLYATSMDYNPKQPETNKFFKIVQAKLHYATTGQTASEIVFNRANAELPFMGLTVFERNQPTQREVTVAKNYLNEKELFALRRIVNSFFDLAELHAMEHKPMYMKDWVALLDKHIAHFDREVLTSAGTVSEQQAKAKALDEYNKYKSKQGDQLTEVEKDYLTTLDNMRKLLNSNVTKKQDEE